MDRTCITYRMLVALAKVTPATPRQISFALYGHFQRNVSSYACTLAKAGYATREGPRNTNATAPGRWSITEKGRRCLTNPEEFGKRRAFVHKKVVNARTIYAKLYHEHLDRQRRMGLTDEQIAAADACFT